MSDLIIYPNPETMGGICISCPCEDSTLSEVINKDLPQGVSYLVVSYSDLPEDKNFIDAWEVDFSSQEGLSMGITINMEKAREIHRYKMRLARIPLLQELDVEFMRALEAGEDSSLIENKKNQLRDCTQSISISNALTTEDLRASWDQELLGPTPYL